MLKVRKLLNKCPYRSPEAVSEAIADLLKDKVVCEIGCAEGDNMTFMKRFCKRVFGFDYDPKRYQPAIDRGLDVRYGDYHIQQIPEAEVYYFWPDDTYECPMLIEKIIAQGKPCTIVAAADEGWKPEVPCILDCHKRFGGEVRKVKFHEGDGDRENGTFHLLIVRS